VLTVKAKVRTKSHPTDVVIPVVVPSLDDVKQLASKLHKAGKPWQGEAFGWQAEYNPSQSEPPIDSKMTFTPADFCIGESGIWFFSLMWEHGNDAAPVEYLDDRTTPGNYSIS
jgi:hypothetical protein